MAIFRNKLKIETSETRLNRPILGYISYICRPESNSSNPTSDVLGAICSGI